MAGSLESRYNKDKVEQQYETREVIARSDFIPVYARHDFTDMSFIWRQPPYFRTCAITIYDYAVPSFCTASMECFGAPADIGEYCRAYDVEQIEYNRKNNAQYKTEEEIQQAKEKGWWREEKSDLLDRFERALAGEQTTFASYGACKLVPDANCHIYRLANIEENNFKFLHYNLYDCPYFFEAGKMSSEVMWLSFVPRRYIDTRKPFNETRETFRKNALVNATDEQDDIPYQYVRAIRIKAENLSPDYSHIALFSIEHAAETKNTYTSTKLFLVEKVFPSEETLIADTENFTPVDIDYSCVFRAMLGDG